MKSLRSKRIATLATILLVIVAGVLYQYRYDRQRIHYRELIRQYAAEYDKKDLPDYLIDVYTQWVINGAGQGKKRKAFLDEKTRKELPPSR